MDTRKTLVKSLRELLFQSQQQAQATDIQEEEIGMSINLPYVEGTSEKLWCILKSHKRRSTLYMETALHKPFCKLKQGLIQKF